MLVCSKWTTDAVIDEVIFQSFARGSKRLIVFDFDRTLATVEVNAVALTDAKKAMGGKYRVSSYTRIYFFINTYLQ